MPYIKDVNKNYYWSEGEFGTLLLAFNTRPIQDAKGDLNWIVSRLVLSWLATNGFIKKVVPEDGQEIWMPTGKTGTYFNMSTMIDALQNSADELKRRFLGPYEDDARRRNGDV